MSARFTRRIDDLPVFDEWDSPKFGLDLDRLTDDIFGRGYQGPLRGSDGSLVVYRNADVRYMSAAKETTHQPAEEVAVYFEDTAGSGADGLLALLRDHVFTMRQPEHLPNKKLSSRQLTTGGVARWSDQATAALAARLDEIADGSSIDLIEDYAKPVVLDFWTRVLGLTPQEAEATYQAQSDFNLTFKIGPDAETIKRASRGVERYLEVLPAALERELGRGENPALNELQRDAESAGRTVRHATYPCKAFAMTLLEGFSTLAMSIAATTYALIASEQCYAQVKGDRSLVPAAYMEGMRLHGPVGMNLRAATHEFTYDGVVLPQGTAIAPMLLMANRDPETFADPNSYRLERDNRGKQASFGGGLYACSGRHLVKMVCEAALTVLTDPSIEIVLTGEVNWTPASFLHELEALPVTVSRV